MAVTPRYPGVYIDEAPSTSHVINGVTTADTAFVDVFERGPVNRPQRITTFGQFTATFGGLSRKSRASYGIYQFFQNGGSTAWVVRVQADKDVSASCKLADFELEAVGPGEWGNCLQAATQQSAQSGLIDLVVREISQGSGHNPTKSVGSVETYPGVSTDSDNARYIVDVLKHQSQLVHVKVGSVKEPKSTPAAGTPISSQDSILNPNKIRNLGSTYENFTGGEATLAFTAGSIGDQGDPSTGAAPTGMYTLETIAPSVFNILCVPAMAGLNSGEWDTAFDLAFNYCQAQRAFMIADPPTDAIGSNDAAGQAHEITTWFESPTISGQTNHAAVYFPRIMIPDPVPAAKGAPYETETSGTMAGIYARTDAAYGVWKAPAGAHANLTGVLGPVVKINDSLNGDLNPLGINSIRTFPVYGALSWGARTIDGADLLESQWKYINVRRLALYIEQSLKQGTTWAVFEPNDEPLWASLRLSVGSFMDGLYKQGAFSGTSAKSSYFVVCDASTTTPLDQQMGRVNVNVGFAPLYPAEFVVITISQITNQ